MNKKTITRLKEKGKPDGLRRIFFLLLVLAFGGLLNNLYAQKPAISVSGTITDVEGLPLIGVNVMEAGTTNGTISDFDGKYMLTVTEGSRLKFSYMGYKTEEKAAARVVNVTLLEDATVLDEIVAVAYGTQRKKDLTGAVSVIDAESMKKMITPNIGQALQGMTTGVNVTTSGAPGSSPDIRIRGVGSFSDVGPLYVIDGMIIDGSQREFNTDDIESMQILKDASATALYGARGANGVILITTKKGKDGPTKIDFSTSIGVQQIANRLETMNSIDFLRVNRAAYENAGKEWPGEPAQGQVLTNTDWQDEFMKTALTQNYNLNISGGNANGHYLFSVNYYNQDGVVKGPEHDRISVRSNMEAKKGIFTFGENLLIAQSNTTPMIGSPFVDLARMPPVIPVYTEDGGYGTGSSAYQTYGTNPIGQQETRRQKQRSKRLIGNAYVQIEPIKGLQLKSNLGIEYHNWFDREITDYKQIRYLDVSTYDNEMLERKGDFLTWIWDNTVFYTKDIQKHHFDVLAGVTMQKTVTQNHTASVKDLADGFWVLDSGVTEPNVAGTDTEYTMSSFLGRVNYNYAGKYLLQFNIRRDGSSRFGKNYRYGVFPSASLGWRISEENFFEGAKSVVDDLKLRASYGVIGDQQALPSYAYTTYIVQGEGGIFGPDQTYYPGAIQKGRANPDLRWESKKTLNLGLDFAFLAQRLYGTIEYFNSDSKDLLIQLPVSWTSGTDETPWTNYGRIQNQGLEFTVGYREEKREFKYNISLNITTLKNKVKDLGEQFRYGGTSGVNRSEEGRSVGDFYVLRTDGIFQNWDEVYAHTATIYDEATQTTQTVMIQPNAAPGDIRYKDLNGDGKISTDDYGDREYAGSPLPKFEAGLNFTAEYKGFDLNIFISGVAGNMIFNNVKYWMERMDETSNYPKDLSPWSPTNPSTTTPRPYMGPTDNTLVTSERWLEKGDYIRLKNIQLGYSFPTQWLEKTKFIERLRIYGGIQNLFTITGYSGFDPEISGGSIFGKGNDNGHFPPVRTFAFGLQASF